MQKVDTWHMTCDILKNSKIFKNNKQFPAYVFIFVALVSSFILKIWVFGLKTRKQFCFQGDRPFK